MADDTPLANAQHLYTQIASALTKSAAKLRVIRSQGLANQMIGMLTSGGLAIILDGEKFRYGAPWDDRVAKASIDLVHRWNRQDGMGEHQCVLKKWGDALTEHIVATAILLADIESRIQVFADKEAQS